MQDDASTSQFRALLEAAPDAMVIIDREGRVAHVNAQAERLFGWTREELLGQPVENLIPQRFRAAHPGHRLRYADEPRPRPMGAAGVDLYGLRKDGSEFPAEVSLSPMEAPEGALVIAAIRDGTARKKVQDQFRRLLEAAPDAMIAARADGRISLVNAQAERLFGYTREELLGQPIEILIPERYRGAHPTHRGAYFANPRLRPMGEGGIALFGRRKDGSEFPAEISLSPMETDEGKVAITAIRDVTERKKADEERRKLMQAQEAIRMRDDFLTIASHELKTPLSALQMQVDSILRMQHRWPEHLQRDPQIEKLHHKVEVINHAVVRLNRLIGQLLDLSRITAGRVDLRLELVDAAALIQTVVGELQDEFARAGCELRVRVEGQVTGRWDALRIEQIVTNLLSNAVKYGAGKPVEVSATEPTPDLVRITVRDHGIGIAPEHQARIFERFERAVSTRNYGGFGLGLWIVRQIIEAHAGSIHVWSEPGAGSTFTVDLPRGLARAGVASAPRVRTQPRVMVVDDDAIIRESFADAVRDEGIDVVAAPSGDEALRLLRLGPQPRVIFLDLMMPGMDGAAFRAEQRKDPALAMIPVVVFSAAEDAEKQAEKLGAAGLLRKPLELKSVLSTIEQHVSEG